MSPAEVVTYTAPGRPARDALLRVPRENPTRTAVVLIHGAGAVPTPPGRTKPSRLMLEGWAEHYASLGYVTLNISFTLAEAPGPTYPAQVVDAKNAVQYLRMRADDLGIDPSRIVVQGHSGGARMGGNVLVTPDDPFFATGSGVSDAANGFIGFYGAYSGVTAAANAYPIFYGGPRDSTDRVVQERWRMANSLAHAAKASGPVLLIHGDADAVPIALSHAMHDRLREAGKHVELIVLPGLDHAFDVDKSFGPPAQLTVPGVLSEEGLKVGERTVEWLRRHFSAAAFPPSR